jgi:RNA polymerase sigma factor (sigma-70 family)
MADNTEWIEKWKEGDNDAFAKIWVAFYPKLVRYAEGRMLNMRKRELDGEDIVASAMRSLCRKQEQDGFEKLDSSDDLFKILYTIVRRKICQKQRIVHSGKGGYGKVRGESVFVNAAGEQNGGLSEAAVSDVTHEEVVEYYEELEKRLAGLNDPKAKEVLSLSFEGYKNEEIAEKMNISLRTVERKREILRKAWLKDLE